MQSRFLSMQEAVNHPSDQSADYSSVDVERWEGNGTIEQPGFPSSSHPVNLSGGLFRCSVRRRHGGHAGTVRGLSEDEGQPMRASKLFG